MFEYIQELLSALFNHRETENHEGCQAQHGSWYQGKEEDDDLGGETCRKRPKGEISSDILICGLLKVTVQMDLQNIKRFTDLDNKLMVAGRRMGEGIVREFGMVMYVLLYSKCITNKILLHSTWKSTQCYVAAWMEGGVWRRMDACMYVRLSPLDVHLKLPQRCYLAIPSIQNKKFIKVWKTKKSKRKTEAKI